jgi:hypothetical protein
MPSGEFAFRRANISLYRAFAERDDYASYPFICESPEKRCTQLIRVSLPDYADVRSHLGRFIVAAGHGDRFDDAHVIAGDDGYEIVEKIGWLEGSHSLRVT